MRLHKMASLPDDEPIDLTFGVGKRVRTVRVGKTHGGYDLLHIVFDDGSTLEVVEQGQTGWFHVNFQEG